MNTETAQARVSGTLDPIVRQWDGHKFGTWYPWPTQVPPTRDFYIVAYIGATGVARFKPNKAGNGGSWANGYSGHATTKMVRYWMPMPDMPNPKVRGGAQSSDVAKQEEQDHA